jgi:prepilin-type N-terminal cleavage/methylation domain-containing protein
VSGRRPTSGFTLLEAMLAVTILGIVATALYGSFSGALRSRAIAEDRIEVTRTGRSALARMTDDLIATVDPSSEGGAGTATATFFSFPDGTDSTPLDNLTFSAAPDRPSGLLGRTAGQQTITYFFAEAANPMRSDRPDPRAFDVVDFFAAFPPRYQLPDDAQPERLLRRQAAPASGDDLAPADGLGPAPATLFLDNVASLEFRFYDGVQWHDDWDSEDPTYPSRLPLAVEIDLALYDATGAIHHFTTAVDLPLANRRHTRPASTENANRSSGNGIGATTRGTAAR